MATLMDKINQGLSSQPSTSQGTGQRGFENILRAKGGKATTGGTTPAATGLAAESIASQGQQELRQGAFQGAMAGAQLRQESENIAAKEKQGQQELASQARMTRQGLQSESKISADQRKAREEEARARRSSEENRKLDMIEANATQRLRELSTQRQLSLDNIFGDFERNNKDLEFRKDAAELEQIGFDLALSDRAYLDELDRIGRERMLTNDLRFNEESARITLGNELTAVLEEADWIKDFNSDKRAWDTVLKQLGIDHAMAMAEAEIKSANTKAAMEGLVNAGQAGYKYGKSQGWFDSTSTPESTWGERQSQQSLTDRGYTAEGNDFNSYMSKPTNSAWGNEQYNSNANKAPWEK